MRQRLAGLTMLSLMLLSTPSLANGAPTTLKDIQGHWAQSMIESAIQRGWVAGYPDGTFHPDAPITRAEFFKLLGVAVQAGKEPATAPFTETEHWSIAQGWIGGAVHAGLIDPGEYPDRQFSPDTPITRQELILAADRAVGLEGLALAGDAPTLTATDAESVPTSLRPWAALAMQNGLLSGYQDGSLGISRGATRAEALTIINRIVGRLSLKLAPVDGTPAIGQRYAPGQPVWYQSGWDGFRPQITGGTAVYTLPEYARGIQILPAPGAQAWVRYTVDENEQMFDVFALMADGQVKEARRQKFRSGQFQNGLAVDAAGGLLYQDGSAIARLKVDGTSQTLVEDLPLSTPVIDGEGNLWGTGANGAQLLKVTPAGEVSRTALPVTPNGQIVVGLIPAPDGGLWALRWDQVKVQTDAIRIKDGQVVETLLLMRSWVHGPDPMPVSLALADQGTAWIERMNKTGEVTWAGTGLYRFDLTTGAFQPALAPDGVNSPLQAGLASRGALLVDGDGRFWTVQP